MPIFSSDTKKPWLGPEYDMEFRMGDCAYCNKYMIISNWKIRNSKTNEIKDIWLCNRCGKILENRVKKIYLQQQQNKNKKYK